MIRSNALTRSGAAFMRVALATAAIFVATALDTSEPAGSSAVGAAWAQPAQADPPKPPAAKTRAEKRAERRRKRREEKRKKREERARKRAEAKAARAARKAAKKAAREAARAARAAKKAGKSGGAQAADKPWYEGVSPADQESAKTTFAEGVTVHKQLIYAEAIDKYKQALSHWDHPDIHYNRARAHISLGQSIQAYNSLLAAMKYGKISLTPEDWATAQEYKTLLEGQLARVEVQCAVTDAVVTIDGEELFRGPGKKELLMVPGPHRVVATRAAYQNADEWLQLNPGERKQVELKPVALATIARLEVSCDEPDAAVILDGVPLMTCPGREEKVVASGMAHVLTISRPGRITNQTEVKAIPGKTVPVTLATIAQESLVRERRLPVWLPWSVAGGGAVIGVLGGLLQRSAFDAAAQYEAGFDAVCSGGAACPESDFPDLADTRDAAILQTRLGVGLIVLGGIGLVAGVTVGLVNQPRTVRNREQGAQQAKIWLVPTVTSETSGVALGGSF